MKCVPKKLKLKPRFCSRMVCQELCLGLNMARCNNVIWQKSPSAEVWVGPELLGGTASSTDALGLSEAHGSVGKLSTPPRTPFFRVQCEEHLKHDSGKKTNSASFL